MLCDLIGQCCLSSTCIRVCCSPVPDAPQTIRQNWIPFLTFFLRRILIYESAISNCCRVVSDRVWISLTWSVEETWVGSGVFLYEQGKRNGGVAYRVARHGRHVGGGSEIKVEVCVSSGSRRSNWLERVYCMRSVQEV